MQPMLNIAVRAARAGGNVIMRYLDKLHDLPVDTKGRNDFVTEVDRQAENAIILQLRQTFPHHSILAEESGLQEGRQGEYIWIIDPLDGTTNFIHGFPQFAVSIALQHRGKLEQAVIYDPMRQELFSASRGAGAQLDGRRIRVSKQSRLDGALIGTGFPFRELQHLDRYLETFRAVITRTAGIRRPGAAALDLAYVACGRLDGFWEFGLKPWDMAAGALLIEEAGGIVADINGDGDFLNSGNILASTPKIFNTLAKLISTPDS